MEERDINTGIVLVDNLLKGSLPPVEVKLQTRGIVELMVAVVLTFVIIMVVKKFLFEK